MVAGFPRYTSQLGQKCLYAIYFLLIWVIPKQRSAQPTPYGFFSYFILKAIVNKYLLRWQAQFSKTQWAFSIWDQSFIGKSVIFDKSSRPSFGPNARLEFLLVEFAFDIHFETVHLISEVQKLKGASRPGDLYNHSSFLQFRVIFIWQWQMLPREKVRLAFSPSNKLTVPSRYWSVYEAA